MGENEHKKVERFNERMKNMADSAAKVFEDWLNSHPDASFEQKHEKLRDVMCSNAMMAIMAMTFSM